jgi:hypothetical protein
VPTPTPPPASPAEKHFSQDDLNRILADDKRKHQSQLQRVEKTLEEALASKNLTFQEREQFAQQLEDLRQETQTKEQRQAHEKKQLEEQLTRKVSAAEKAAKEWEHRYCEGMVERALQDAAVSGEAFNAGTVMAVLRPLTRLTEVTDDKTGKGTGKFKVQVDFPDTDAETGQPTTVAHTPDGAVKRMKELPQIYGNLFKSGVVSGIGGSAAAGGIAPGGKLDPRKIAGNMEEYMRVRELNPALLGLRAPKKPGLRR